MTDMAASAGLTPAQLQTLHTDILANPTWTGLPNGPDEASTIAAFYNALASPNYYVWRSSVNINDIMKQPGFDWTRVDNLTVGKSRIWEFMKMTGTLDQSKANVRAGIEACWSVEAGDQTTRQAIYDSSARLATRAEKLFTSGSGTAPTHHGVGPSVAVFEGNVTYQEVQTARALP